MKIRILVLAMMAGVGPAEVLAQSANPEAQFEAFLKKKAGRDLRSLTKEEMRATRGRFVPLGVLAAPVAWYGFHSVAQGTIQYGCSNYGNYSLGGWAGAVRDSALAPVSAGIDILGAGTASWQYSTANAVRSGQMGYNLRGVSSINSMAQSAGKLSTRLGYFTAVGSCFGR